MARLRLPHAWFRAALRGARPTVLALGPLVLAACGSEAPPPEPPPGAVIGVGNLWILEEEVDHWVDTIALLEPTETRRSWRRKALTNLVLPVKLASLILPVERQAALAEAQQARLQFADGGALPESISPRIQRAQGTFLDVGLHRWALAKELPQGQWSEVFEEPGMYTIERVLEAPPTSQWRGSTQIRIEFIHFPYLLPEENPTLLIDDAAKQFPIWALDPEWEWILPKFYQ